MIEYITLAALVAFTFIGPFVKRGGLVAKHNALMVKLPLDETTLLQGNHPEGRRAQEIGENRFQGIIGLLSAFSASLLLSGEIAALTMVLAYIVTKSLLYAVPAIDTAGHGAEIMVAEADGDETYYMGEIARMLRDPKRKGKTFQDVTEELRRVRWLSRIMVRLAW